MTQTSSDSDEISTTDRVRGAGSQIAGTAAEEVSNVKHEVGAQARNLVGEVRSQLTSQAKTQQERAAGGIRSISDELRSMADASESNSVASSLVSQAASRAGDAAGWLERTDPAGVLDDVKRFARRRPGLFIAIAASTGIVVGRLAKSLASSGDSAENAEGHTDVAPETPSVDAETISHTAPADGPSDYVSGGLR